MHVMSQHAKPGLKREYFSLCLTYLKFTALIRQREVVIHAAFYFMWHYKSTVHPGAIANIEDGLLRSILESCSSVCLKWLWAWSPAAATFQEYPEHPPVSYLMYEHNAKIYIIPWSSEIFCDFSGGEIFQLEMRLFMCKENEDSQGGQGGRGLTQWVAPQPLAGRLELDQLWVPFQPRILSFYEKSWVLLLSLLTRWNMFKICFH